MISSPDLPNAAMTQWIMYIQLFTFEVQHTPGTSHKVLDGLSCQLQAEDDSDFSDNDVDLEDGIKLVKVQSVETSDSEPMSLQVWEDLAKTRLSRKHGEIKALEMRWS